MITKIGKDEEEKEYRKNINNIVSLGMLPGEAVTLLGTLTSSGMGDAALKDIKNEKNQIVFQKDRINKKDEELLVKLRSELGADKTFVFFNKQDPLFQKYGPYSVHKDSIDDVLSSPSDDKLKEVLKKSNTNSFISVGEKTTPEVLAHELGHTSSKLENNQLFRFLQKASRKLYTHPTIGFFAGTLNTGVAAARGYNSAYDKEDNKLLNGINIGYGAMSLPMLAEEAQASIRGRSALKKVMGGKLPEGATKRLLKAFGSYGIRAGSVGVAAPLAAYYSTKYLAEKKRKEKKFNGLWGKLL